VKTFTLLLQDASHTERIEGVTSFVGEDASGSFGVLRGHARMLTALSFGLCRFRIGTMPWRYLALPGGLLYFRDNQLCICTRHYLMDDDYGRISEALQEQLVAEEEQLQTAKASLRQMEQAILKRLWEIGRGQGFGR
jgi:F-type H+-transporting ATPase subunit epsilon